jgi:hypothetical protein
VEASSEHGKEPSVPKMLVSSCTQKSVIGLFLESLVNTRNNLFLSDAF